MSGSVCISAPPICLHSVHMDNFTFLIAFQLLLNTNLIDEGFVEVCGEFQ